MASVTHGANKNLCCSRWLSVRRQIIVQRCIPRRAGTSCSADSIVASLLVRRFLLLFLPRPREQRHEPLRRTGRPYTRTAMPRKTPACPLRKIEFVCELREPNCADGISSRACSSSLSIRRTRSEARRRKMRERERKRENISYSRGSDSYL